MQSAIISILFMAYYTKITIEVLEYLYAFYIWFTLSIGAIDALTLFPLV
jgi:hypothetical protein